MLASGWSTTLILSSTTVPPTTVIVVFPESPSMNTIFLENDIVEFILTTLILIEPVTAVWLSSGVVVTFKVYSPTVKLETVMTLLS